jgi:hypothetical protein
MSSAAPALPTFFLVGAAKAGTTALHLFLSEHPQIFMSPVKETNHFSQPDMDKAHYSRDYRHDVNVNLARFLDGPMDRKIHIADVERWEDYARLFRDVTDEIAIGEASNSYLLCPSAAPAIAEKLPEARILMMLRNPIERAWSHYLMVLRLGKTLEKEFLREIESDSRAPRQGWGVSQNYVELGRYSEQLERYRAHFPADRIKVLVYDDFRADSEGTLRGIFAFLGVDPGASLELERSPNAAAVPRFRKLNYLLFQSGLVNRVKRMVPEGWKGAAKKAMFTRADMPTLGEAERQVLCDTYRDEVSRLGELLGRDLSHWVQPKRA